MKALFSHLQLSQFLRDAAHESFVFTSSAFSFLRDVARKPRFHILNCQFLRDISHESFAFTSLTVSF